MRANEVLQLIGTDDRPIEMVTTPVRLFILIAHIQLALRHPDNTGSSTVIAREMADNMTEMLCTLHPYARPLIEAGWVPSFDLTREEFEEAFPDDNGGVWF